MAKYLRERNIYFILSKRAASRKIKKKKIFDKKNENLKVNKSNRCELIYGQLQMHECTKRKILKHFNGL